MRWIIPFFLLLILPLGAFADGVVIPATAFPAKVTIPDQRALICWSNGTERLAIETRFTGEGTNFAWVLPLPSKPVIEEATSGLFTTVEHIFRPAIVHNVPPLYSGFLFCTGVAFLLITVRRNTPPRISDSLVSVLVALALIPLSICSAIPLILLLPYAVWRVRTGAESPLVIFVVLLLAMLMGGMMLPALGSAGSTVSDAGVSILNRQTVGVYDTTTITSKEPQALLEWLHDNGYALPPAANKSVSNYVNRGWVFVATQLRRDSSGQVISTPQPLCFTFQSDTAVYPMQLTGVENSQLGVELFVFGALRAEAGCFQAERCTTPIYQARENNFRYPTGQVHIAHPLLRKWAAGLPVATKLTAKLTQEMMAEDIELRWVPFVEIRQSIYSFQGAGIFGLNWGTGVFAACLLVASIWAAFKRERLQRLKRLVWYAAAAGVLVAAVIFVALPKTSVRLTRLPALRSQRDLHHLGGLLAQETPTNGMIHLAEARVALKRIQDLNPGWAEQNLLLGGPIREEDSPGNYILRQATNGVEYIWFDADGGEHPLN